MRHGARRCVSGQPIQNTRVPTKNNNNFDDARHGVGSCERELASARRRVITMIIIETRKRAHPGMMVMGYSTRTRGAAAAAAGFFLARRVGTVTIKWHLVGVVEGEREGSETCVLARVKKLLKH